MGYELKAADYIFLLLLIITGFGALNETGADALKYQGAFLGCLGSYFLAFCITKKHWQWKYRLAWLGLALGIFSGFSLKSVAIGIMIGFAIPYVIVLFGVGLIIDTVMAKRNDNKKHAKKEKNTYESIAESKARPISDFTSGVISPIDNNGDAIMNVSNSPSKKAHYETAWVEIEKDKKDMGIWAEAFVICEGDESKTKIKYIELRVADLLETEKDEKKMKGDVEQRQEEHWSKQRK